MDYYETRRPVDHPPLNTAKDFYVNLLGLRDIPLLPENLPDRVIITPLVLGGFELAILDTIEDNQERRQFIFWNAKGARNTPLYLGAENGGLQGSNRMIARSFFGEKPLIEFHTHGEGAYSTPSPYDIASGLSFPRMAFIRLVGSQHNVYALFQTEKASRLPFSTILKALQVHISLEKNDFSRARLSKQAAMLNKYGLGFYYHEANPWYGFEKNYFQKGLLLTKA